MGRGSFDASASGRRLERTRVGLALAFALGGAAMVSTLGGAPVVLSAVLLLASAGVVVVNVARGALEIWSHRANPSRSHKANSTGAAWWRKHRDDDTRDDEDRRHFLRFLGMGALVFAPLPVLKSLPRQKSDTSVAMPAVHKPSRGRLRQWIMIIDLRYCDGCQSRGTPPQCTTACTEGHFVPEPMEWIEVYESELPGGGTQFVPTPCLQCQNAPCVNVCPVAATFHAPEGTVLIDQKRCIGCRICMAACPYDRRFFNWGQPPVPPESLLADYSPEHQVPMTRGTVVKCDFCPDMVRTGTLPYCIQACPQRAIYYGDLEEDVATNGSDMVKASRFLSENQAYRQKEDLGTKSRVYYLPGHGEAVGRDAFSEGRLPSEWPWIERVKGARTWER